MTSTALAVWVKPLVLLSAQVRTTFLAWTMVQYLLDAPGM